MADRDRIPRPCSVVLLLAWVSFPGCGALPIGVPRDPDETDENLVVFSDPDSDFETTDVWDVDEEIIRFDGVADTLIWVADNLAFEGWEVSGNFLGAHRELEVKFGTKDGQRRAYFTKTGHDMICQIFVAAGVLVLIPTNVPVPNE